MKTKDWLIIGGVALGGFFLWKYLQGGSMTFGGGDGGNNTIPTSPNVPYIEQTVPISVPNIPIPPGGFIRRTADELRMIHAGAGQRQAWLGGTFGSPGQPSVAFKERTILQAKPVSGVGTVSPVVTVTTPKRTITISKPLAVSKGAKVVTIKPTTIAQQRTILAASVIMAGAPPRVVAKIKGGSWY